MESPAYLNDQYAKSCGLSAPMAKRALMLAAYARDGATLKFATKALRISSESGKRIARRMLIDFTDYRPYAAIEAKGGERPQPFRRDIAVPADSLPPFSNERAETAA